MTDTLSVRIVRAVHQVQPRWLTGSQVTGACPDDNGSSVYATLSNLAKESKGPLRKRRSDGGVYEYSTIDGFDLEEWLSGRTPKVRVDSSGSRAAPDEPEVQIVKTLLAAKRRLTADEILACGDHMSKESLVLRLAAMVKPDAGVLERDREEIGKPWTYGVRRDIDVESWLRERGSSYVITGTEPEAVTGLSAFNAREPEPAAPPARSPAAPSKEGAEPARAAATKTVAAQTSENREASDRTSSPGEASAPAAVPPTATTQSPDDDLLVIPRRSERAPPPPAAPPPVGTAFDLATEIALVAAANLAALLHDCELPPDLARALSTFERAFAMQGRVQKEARAL